MANEMPAGLAQALGDRPVMIPAPFVQKHGMISDTIENVHQTYNLPIIVNGDGAHYKNCPSWSQYRMSTEADPYVYMLQLLSLGVEDTTQGGMTINVDRNATPKLYYSVAFAAARTVLHLGKPSDKNLIEKYLRPSFNVDLEFRHTVEQCVMKLEATKGSKKKNADGGVDLEGGDAADEEEDRNADAAAAAAAADNVVVNYTEHTLQLEERERQRVLRERRTQPWGRLLEELSNGDEGEHTFYATLNPEDPDGPMVCALGVPGVREFLDGPASQFDTSAEAMAAEGARIAAVDVGAIIAQGVMPLEPDPEEDDDDDGGLMDMDVDVENGFLPFDGDEPRVPKVTFTVTPIPKEGGNHNVHNDIVGYMVRFVVRDPNWNPGEVFDNILKAIAVRKKGAPTRGPGKSSHTTDLLNNYFRFFQSNHPAGNYTTLEGYVRMAASIDPSLKDGGVPKMMRDANPALMDNATHMSNILTTKNALQVLRDAGGDSRYLQHFQWHSARSRAALFPAELDTYRYMPQQVVWYHPENCGLSEQYFPDVSVDDNYRRVLMNGGDVSPFLRAQGQDYAEMERDDADMDRVLSPVQRMIQNNFIIRRKLVTEGRLSYKTNNEFMHKQAEAKAIAKAVKKHHPAHYMDTMARVQELVAEWGTEEWRVMMDEGLEIRVKECERYNSIVVKAHEASMKIFEGLWQLEGDTTQLPVPESIKCMLDWYKERKENGKLPNLTREFVNYDPEMDTFGNSMIRQLLYYGRLAKIIQPLICVLNEGLFSVYDGITKTLAFHMTLHGRYDVGKTFTAITTLCDYSTIPGTVSEQSSSSAQADTTQKHAYDEIRARDEVEPWEVSALEAAKCPDRVNKEKIKMTRGQIGRAVFVSHQLPCGTNVRWQENIITDQMYTSVSTTNHTVEEKGALASRTATMTVKQTDIPSNELSNKIAAILKGDSRLSMQINQFLSACGKKATMVGAIPQPEMTLFDNLSNRVLAYLRKCGAITAEDGQRSLEIMRPLMRQFIYKRAIHEAFDKPCSPHYQKEFHTSMIDALSPYLYATTSMTWFVWTALASQWVNGDLSNVLRAATEVALKPAGVKWTEVDTPYSLYERDIKNVTGRIPWRETKNTAYVDGDKVGDKTCVNLQYLQLKGEKRQIASLIASCTRPVMSVNDVMGVLDQLAQKNFPLPNGGYMEQPKATFANWHKYTTPPDPRTDAPGIKRTGVGMTGTDYLGENADTSMMRRESDVPIMGNGIAMPVVDMSELKKGKGIYFIPQAGFRYREDVIEDALMMATMCDTTRVGKMILGTPDEKDPSLFRVYKVTKRGLHKQVRHLDENNGWAVDPETGENCFVDSSIPENERAISRKEGITFSFRGGITSVENKMLMAAPGAPVIPGDDSWKKAYKNALDGMKTSHEVWGDLDAHSAALQHMACGRPLDEPVRTPKWIAEQDRVARRAKGMNQHLDCDYPHNIKKERDAMMNRAKEASSRRMVSKETHSSNINASITIGRDDAMLTVEESRAADEAWEAEQAIAKRRWKRRNKRPAPDEEPVVPPVEERQMARRRLTIGGGLPPAPPMGMLGVGDNRIGLDAVRRALAANGVGED